MNKDPWHIHSTTYRGDTPVAWEIAYGVNEYRDGPAGIVGKIYTSQEDAEEIIRKHNESLWRPI
jgi:hypothetical protein